MADSGDTYLSEAVDRLLAGLMALNGDGQRPIIVKAQKNLLPLPTRYPFIIAYQGGFQVQLSDEGDSYQRQEFVVTLRYILARVEEGLNGYYQNRLWVDQVTILNWINDHPTLIFEPGQDDIDELHPDGVFATGGTRLGVFRDDPVHIGVEFSVTLPFHVTRDMVW
ncbi:MAG: hypothetical protein OHK0046_46030 [Anaerolineae bacterium]